MFVQPTKQGKKAIQCMQFGLQYFEFTQQMMVERIHLLHSYIDQAKNQLTQMKKIDQNQKAKLKKYKKQNQEFDDQALHYEYLIRKYRPDLDPEKL